MTRPVFQGVRMPRGQDGEGTTQLMNLRSKNLFEVFNAAEIYDENFVEADSFGDLNFDDIRIKSVVFNGHCYACIDRMVSVFRVSDKAEFAMSFELEAEIADICVLREHGALLFVLASGGICFYLCEQTKLTIVTPVFTDEGEDYKVAVGGTGPFLCAGVTRKVANAYEAKFVTFPPFATIYGGSTDFMEQVQVVKSISLMPRCYMAADEENFAFFPHRKDTPVATQSVFELYQSHLADAPLAEAYFLPCGARSVHRVGNLTGVLLESLDCALLSSLAGPIASGELQLGSFRGDVHDFAMLDFEGSALNANNRMAVHVSDGNKDKVILADALSQKVAFEFESSSRVCLHTDTAPTDVNNNVVILEAFSKKRATSVQLRFVYEAQPEVRLRNLLDKGRFEEALDCARLYNLPLDRVYERQISFLIEGVQREGFMTNDDLETLLKLLRQLSHSQEESAVDYAFLAVTTSTEHRHIRELLTFCAQCHTSDEEVRENLERLRYALDSYCALFGHAASFARDSYWHGFWMGDNHWELFVKMLEEAKIEKCSQLWSRYRASMSDHLMTNSADIFSTLLVHLERTVVDSTGAMATEVAQFLEKDLLPPFFTESNVDYLVPWQDRLMSFFIKLSLTLWQLDQGNYPQNAHRFASTFFRVVNLQLTRNGDAAEKQWIARCMMSLKVGVIDFSSSCEVLSRVVVKLNQLAHLKTKYDFVSSYESYQNLSAVDVGTLLLDKVYTVRNIVGYVKEVVFVYCAEFNLDQDTLLLNYIRQADLSRIVNVCIEMCKLFVNQDYCAKAAMFIAPACALPWSSELTQLFARLSALTDLPEMTRKALRDTILNAKISMVLQRYGALGMLDIAHKRDVIGYCGAIFTDTNDVPIAERAADAQKICLLTLNNPHLYLTSVELFSSVIRRAFSNAKSSAELGRTLALLDHIDDEDVLAEVAAQSARYAYSLLCRSHALNAYIPLSVNFLTKIADYVADKTLREAYVTHAYSVLQLYELYGEIVFADQLAEPAVRRDVLRKIMDKDAEKSFDELLQLGTLLLMPVEDVIVERIVYCVESNLDISLVDALRAVPSAVAAYSEALVTGICYGVAFLLTSMSDGRFTTMEVDRLNSIRELVQAMQLAICDRGFNADFTQLITPVYEYCEFLGNVTALCKYIDTLSVSGAIAPTQQPVVPLEENVILDLEASLKLPMYTLTQEPKTTTSNTVLQTATSVAETLCTPLLAIFKRTWPALLLPDAATSRARWTTLLRTLFDREHDLIAVAAFQLCSRQPFFDEHCAELHEIYDAAVGRLMERLLAAVDVDWITCAEHVGFRGQQRSATLIKQMRLNTALMRNRTVLVNSYLFKFVFADAAGVDSQHAAQFRRFSWQRELMAEGVNLSSKLIDHPARSIAAYADSNATPARIMSLCRSYNYDADSVLQLYAIKLCMMHSRKECKQRGVKLSTARASLDAIEAPNKERIRQMLAAIEQHLCPYDYEILRMALDWCQQHVTDTEHADWVAQMQKFLAFLSLQKRRDVSTAEERAWYQQRYARIAQAEAPPASERETTLTSTSSGGSSGAAANAAAEDHNPLALVRLPFQAFLADAHAANKDVGTVICANQATTETLHAWVKLALELPRILPCGRCYLEAATVYSDLRRCLEAREACDDTLMLLVLNTVQESSTFVPAIHSITTNLGDIVLSSYKVDVFDKFLDVLQRRLKEVETNEAHPDSADLSRMRTTFVNLTNARNAFFVSNLLFKYNLNSAHTQRLTGDVLDLCKHILQHLTNWDDPDSIARHINFIQDLEAQQLVSLAAVFDDLIVAWLRSNLANEDLSNFSMDVSMEGDDEAHAVACDLAVPYFSADVTRMAFFLKYRCDKELASKIKTLKFLDVKEGVEQKIRVLCVIYRALGAERCRDMFDVIEEDITFV